MSEQRVLTYDAPNGHLRFSWVYGARDIEVYSLTEGQPGVRLGFLTSREWQNLNQLVDYEQDAFERHCRRFLDEAAQAEVRAD